MKRDDCNTPMGFSKPRREPDSILDIIAFKDGFFTKFKNLF